MTPACGGAVSKDMFIKMPHDMPSKYTKYEHNSVVLTAIATLGEYLNRPAKFGAELFGFGAFNLTPGSKNYQWKTVRIALQIGYTTFGLTFAIATSPLLAVGMLLKTMVSYNLKDVVMTHNPAVSAKTLGNNDESKVCSYNTALMCRLFSTANKTRNPRVRAEEISQAFQGRDDLDIVALQEALDPKSRDNLCESLSDNFRFVIKNAFPREWGLDSGLVMATNFEPVALKGICFTNGQSEDHLMNKGAVIACLKTADGEHILVANTHLQAKDDDEGSTFFTDIRKEQLKEIKKQMKQFATDLSDAGIVVKGHMIMGDLNMNTETVESTQVFDEVEKKRDSSFYDLELKGSTWGSGSQSWSKNTAEEESLDYTHMFDTSIYEKVDESVDDFVTPKGAHSGSSDHIPLISTIARKERLVNPALMA